jgi:hypothetical protein
MFSMPGKRQPGGKIVNRKIMEDFHGSDLMRHSSGADRGMPSAQIRATTEQGEVIMFTAKMFLFSIITVEVLMLLTLITGCGTPLY